MRLYRCNQYKPFKPLKKMKNKIMYIVKSIYKSTGEIEKVWLTTSSKENARQMFKSLRNGMEIQIVIEKINKDE